MAKVRFTAALKRFYPKLQEEENVPGTKISEVLAAIDEKYPGIIDYVVDEEGALRKHVNIFLREELIKDKLTLSDPVAEQDEVLIYQALSGG